MSGRWGGIGAREALVAVGAGVMVIVGVAAARTTASPPSRVAGQMQETAQDPVFAVLPDRMPGGERDTPQLIELGRRLYFETALSSDGSMSCNSCHRIDADLAGTDYLPTSLGVRGNVGGRNAPTVLNAGYQMGQFWDARAKDLEEQAGGPPLNPIEMAMADSAALEAALRAAPGYRDAFRLAFPDDPEPVTFVNATRAIAAFERTLRTPARLDAYLEGNSGALSEREIAGMRTLVDVGCTICHRGALLGGDRLMKMGLVHPYAWSGDEGAGEGMFKVAQLRNVTLTPPYFHDGHASTIAEAVDRMAWMQLGRELKQSELLDLLSFLTATADSARTVEASWEEEGWWAPRDPAAVPEGQAAYGLLLMQQTAQLLGIDGGTAGHVVGNELTCTHCHQDQGTKRYGLTWVGVASRYPTYNGRAGEVRGLEARINGCLERSMNGQPLPEDSREMGAMVAYLGWLSEGAPEDLKGAGSPEFHAPERRADLDGGGLVYMGKCQSCHGPDGAGYTNRAGIVMVPPLWGDRSYNDGAGMGRLLTSASFIRANMPLGTLWNRPALSEGEAYDVAAFMNSHERPVRTGKEVDYPNLLDKPVDAPYPPYPDEFSVDQHRFGPFGPIEAARRALREKTARVANPYVPAGDG